VFLSGAAANRNFPLLPPSAARFRRAVADRDTLRPMKPDLYTKTILTVIAGLLALNQIANFGVPSVLAQSRGLKIHMAKADGYAGDAAIIGTCSSNCYVLYWGN
jgi:hypothetical protein